MSGLNKIFSLLMSAAVVSLGNARPPQKIIGGSFSAANEFPYQVSLKLDGRHICGGAIIHPRYIITAAHCVVGVVEKPYTNFIIETGSNMNYGGQVHRVKSVHAHADYVPFQGHDIAVIELEKNIKFDSNQNKINLPTNDTKSGVAAVASGWGLESFRASELSEKLKKVVLHTLDHRECQLFSDNFKISPHQICTFHAPGRGVCVGDSGGPLARDNTLIGIVSYGEPCAIGKPDVYTNVWYYVKWIKEKCGMS